MVRTHPFDERRARKYRKRAEILAFRADAAFVFRKAWGEQSVRAGGWVIVPLTDGGEATEDLYGCDADVFEATYEASPSLRPNRYRKKETVLAYQPGEAFELDTVLADGHTEVKNARSGAWDDWIVRAPGGEVYPVDAATFKSTYVNVVERSPHYHVKNSAQHWDAKGLPKRILSLDGGGVRGVVTLGFLARIEQILQARHGGSDAFRLCHYFDLIAGTSTGAIIAACLAKGMRVDEVRTLYVQLSQQVFRRSYLRGGKFRARYSANQLEQCLESVFKKNTMGSAALQTGLLVVAKRLDTGSIWPMSNNPGNRWYTAKPGDSFFSNEDYLVREVVRASTAAPSYFAPQVIQISDQGEKPHGLFVDGGASPHNNPALLASQLVCVGGFGAGWSLDPDKLLLTSVGTGTAQPGASRSWWAGGHAIQSLLSVIDDCAELVETTLQWISDSPTARHIDAAMQDLRGDLLAERPLLHYLRYNVHLEETWLREILDEVRTKKEIKRLQAMDRPDNVDVLSTLAVKAARLQVRDEHFPKHFDLE
jgi:hypothetical protein